MCLNARYVYNPYTKHSIFVDCGICQACKQAKAMKRARRIKDEASSNNNIALFVTLTYDRYGCPYVEYNDIKKNNGTIDVKREYYTYRDRFNKTHRVYSNQLLETRHLDSIDFDGQWYKFDPTFAKLSSLKHRKNHIGVIYYPDIQNFEKRLRINLKRIYKYEKPFKFFNCAEYGETTCRPHFHVLFFIPYSDIELFKSAIVQAWPYGDSNRLLNNIEIARDAASYVASYVNSGSTFPRWLNTFFPPKHSYSHGFGVDKECYSLPKILQKVREGDLRYTMFRNTPTGEIQFDMAIPKYVINRFFPLFKGFSKLTKAKVLDLLQYPRSLSGTAFKSLCEELDYTADNYHKFVVSQDNAYKRYHNITGRDRYSYALDFYETWQCRKRTLLKQFYERKDDYPEPFYYDNISKFFYDSRISPSLMEWIYQCDDTSFGVTLDPNTFPDRVQKDYYYRSLYEKKLKTKSVNNAVFSQFYDDV